MSDVILATQAYVDARTGATPGPPYEFRELLHWSNETQTRTVQELLATLNYSYGPHRKVRQISFDTTVPDRTGIVLNIWARASSAADSYQEVQLGIPLLQDDSGFLVFSVPDLELVPYYYTYLFHVVFPQPLEATVGAGEIVPPYNGNDIRDYFSVMCGSSPEVTPPDELGWPQFTNDVVFRVSVGCPLELRIEIPFGFVPPEDGIVQVNPDRSAVGFQQELHVRTTAEFHEQVLGPDPTDTRSLVPREYVDDAMPIGTIALWPQPVPSRKWMTCEGQLLFKNKYPELAQLLGDTYGEGTSDTFQLPDLSAAVPAGMPNMRWVIYTGHVYFVDA